MRQGRRRRWRRQMGLRNHHCKGCGERFLATCPAQLHCGDLCRFLSMVAFPSAANGCLMWAGTRHGKGYGHFRKGTGVLKAHRASYELFCGPIPDGLLVLHRCDNPTCVNPDHLFLGTNDDNMADRQAKTRQARGERAGRARLKEAAVRDIRSSPASTKELAQKYSVAPETIKGVRSGRTWRHIV